MKTSNLHRLTKDFIYTFLFPTGRKENSIEVKEDFEEMDEWFRKNAVNHCPHTRVWNEVSPDMGYHPSSWTCNDCNTSVPITWVPVPWTWKEKHCGCIPEAKVWCGNHVPYASEDSSSDSHHSGNKPEKKASESSDENEVINEGLDRLYEKDESGHWGYDKHYIDSHFYTKEDIDSKRSKMQDVIVTNNTEEREWRKSLLDYLYIPNMGCGKGEHISRDNLEKRLHDLERFL